MFRIMTDDPQFLEGKALVAMPSMGDPRFSHSVVFMCAHSSDGAMGLIINKPVAELTFVELLEQLDITVDAPTQAPTVFFGGPVEHGRGFVLHTDDYSSEGATLQVHEGYGMTATVDILRDIAKGNGPRASLMALGYASWGPGQLEGEIQANGWLISDVTEELIFGISPDGRWEAALASIGIDPKLLSAEGGRA